MTYEVEQKYYVDDLDTVRQSLEDLGVNISPEHCQVDSYLAHPLRDFSNTDEALRLRSVGNENFITYKGPKIDQTTKTRLEVELPLPDGQEFAGRFQELFSLLGFTPVIDVRKQRRTGTMDWHGVEVEIALDVVEGLGTFVELETAADDASLENARQQLATLAEALGLRRNERLSYCELLLKRQAETKSGNYSTVK